MRNALILGAVLGLCGCISRIDVAPPVPLTVYTNSARDARDALGENYADVYEGVAVKLEALKPGQTISSDVVEQDLKTGLPKARAKALEKLEDDMAVWVPRDRPLTREDAPVYRGIGKGWRK